MVDELEALRPSGTMPITCTTCGWSRFAEALDPDVTAAASGSYTCSSCITNPEVGTRCSACNRHFKSRHRELTAQGNHKRCSSCKDIPPMQFAAVVHCWCCDCGLFGSPMHGQCCGDATQLKRYPKGCDCEACWQTWFHVCDKHAEEWTYDKPIEVQKAMFRKRGARIIEYPDGGWSVRWPHQDEALRVLAEATFKPEDN